MRALGRVFPTTGGNRKKTAIPNGLMPDLSKQAKGRYHLRLEKRGRAHRRLQRRQSVIRRILMINEIHRQNQSHCQAEYKEELLARRIRRLTFIFGHKDGSLSRILHFPWPRI